MPTQKKFTIPEAAENLRISSAAVHKAIKAGRLEWEWGEITQVITKKVRMVSAKALKNYQVDLSRQERGKKT
jgi:hypothetical protein